MTQNIEKFRLEERIYLSYCKHRGDADRVSREIGVPYDFALKICNKLKKRQDRNVNLLICSHIMGTVLLGRESRMQYYTSMINALEGRDSIELSACCKSLMVVKLSHEPPVCLKCGKQSRVYLEHQSGIYSLRMELLKELREEDHLLVEFSEKMGYTQKQEGPSVMYKDERKYLFLGSQGSEPRPELTGIDEKQKILLEEAGRLNPIDRTDLINRIQQGLEDISKEKKEDGPAK